MRTLPACAALVALVLPAAAAAFSRTGIVTPLYQETADPSGGMLPAAPPRHVLHRPHRRHVPLADDPRYLDGAKMRVRGTLDASGALVPAPDDRSVKLLRLPPQTPTLPVETMLVLLVDHPDTPHTRTVTDLGADFDRLRYWTEQSSYGHTTLAITMPPWRQTPTLSPPNCGFWGVLDDALAAHAADIGDLAAYSIVYVVEATNSACTDGSALGGGGVRAGTVGYAITGEWWAVSIHELGHAFGLAHANGLDCGSTTGIPPDFATACIDREYGGHFDYMAQAFGDLHALHKRQLGWLRTAGPETSQTVSAPGTYTIEGLEFPAGATGVKALFLPRATIPLTWLTLEARFVAGLDQLYPDDWLAGVQVGSTLAGFHVVSDVSGAIRLGSGTSNEPWLGTSHTMTPASLTIPVGGQFDDWPWRVRVLSRTTSPPVVTVAIEPAPSPSPSPDGGNIGGGGTCCPAGSTSAVCTAVPPLYPPCP